MVLVEGAVSLLLIAILIVISQFRSRLLAISRRAYLSISGGFSLMGITAMVRVARETGIFVSAPFFAEPIVFNLFCTIALITGATLVGSGIAILVSILVDRNRSERESWAHLLIMKQVEQLAQVEHRLDNLLMFTLEQYVSDLAFSRGAVVKISPRTGRVGVVGSVGDICLSDSDWLALSRLNQSDDRAISGVALSIVIPVLVHHRIVALFAFWSDGQSEPNRQVVQSMHVVAGIIARKIERDELALYSQYLADKNQIRYELEQELSDQTELPTAVSAMAGILRKHLGADVVTLLWFQPEQSRMSRFTVGDSGTLTEHKVPMPEPHTVGGWIFGNGEPMLITDACDTTVTSLDGPLAAAEIRSIVAVPLIWNNSTVGALIIGGSTPHAFSRRQLEVAIDCSWSICRLLQKFESDRKAHVRQREAVRTIQRIASPINQFGSVEYFVETANLIARELGSEMVRISAVDSDNQFIESLAAAGPASGSVSVPAQGTLVLSLLDRHREVIESGRPFSATISGSATFVSRTELDHVFGHRCRSLHVLPLKFDGQLVGLISLGSTTEIKHIMSPIEESLLSLISGNLAIAIASHSGAGHASFVPSGYTRAVAANRAERELRNRLRSPLTGILGSLELMRNPSSAASGDHSRYLEIIDKSAQRIQKYLEQPETISR